MEVQELTGYMFVVVEDREKATKMSIPYWLKTGEEKSKHTQKYITLWVPKSLIKDNLVPDWFVRKHVKELIDKCPGYKAGNLYNTLGQYAPVKEKCTKIVPDTEAQNILYQNKIKEIIEKVPEYKSAFFILDAYYITGMAGCETIEDEVKRDHEYKEYIKQFNSLTKQITYYK